MKVAAEILRKVAVLDDDGRRNFPLSVAGPPLVLEERGGFVFADEENHVVIAWPYVAACERSVDPDGPNERALRLEEVLREQPCGGGEVLGSVEAGFGLRECSLTCGRHPLKNELASVRALFRRDTDVSEVEESPCSPAVEGLEAFVGCLDFAGASAEAGAGREDVEDTGLRADSVSVAVAVDGVPEDAIGMYDPRHGVSFCPELDGWYRSGFLVFCQVF